MDGEKSGLCLPFFPYQPCHRAILFLQMILFEDVHLCKSLKTACSTSLWKCTEPRVPGGALQLGPQPWGCFLAAHLLPARLLRASGMRASVGISGSVCNLFSVVVFWL